MTFLGLDVANAGVGSMGAAEETSVEQARAVFDTNVFGVMRMVNEVLPHMRAQRRGRITTESLDHEVRDHGVRALIVEPAYTRTGFEANSAKPGSPLHAYAKQRQTVDRVMAEAVRSGDAPAGLLDKQIRKMTQLAG